MIMGSFLQIASVFYILIVIFAFFLKKKVMTIENRLFGLLIIESLVGLIIDLIYYVALYFFDTYNIAFNIIIKSIIVYSFIWFLTITFYVYVISRGVTYDDRTENLTRWYKYIRFKKIIYIVGVVISIVLIVLPVYFESETIIHPVSTSPSYLLLYGLGVTIPLIWIILLLSGVNEFFSRKNLPMFMYMVLGLVTGILQFKNPTIALSSPVEAFITVLIFFTKEDPNYKLLEYERTERERANKISESKSKFLENMSSELRTPLESIVGLSEDLETYMANTPAEVQEDIKDIYSASRTLMEIVGSIMDISKIEGGKLEIIPSDYAPKDEFKTLAKIMRTKVAEKPLKFNVDIAENIPDVLYGDRIRIKQIINNLLSNAIKYTEKGNVDFSVEWYLASNSLFIKVSDTGRGVKPEDLDRLFAKYDRLSVEKISSVQGTGLGLSITKELIEKMGGKIEVESVYGAGTTFKVTIPQQIGNKAAYEQKMKQKEATHSSVDLSGKKILIVDDNLLNIKTLRKTLKKCNLVIEECYNGKEAIDKININQYDLVLMDLSMPVMTGEEAIRVLRSYSDFSTPIIAISANAVSDIEQKVIEMGFDDYLIKPYVKEQIIEKIENMIKD